MSDQQESRVDEQQNRDRLVMTMKMEEGQRVMGVNDIFFVLAALVDLVDSPIHAIDNKIRKCEAFQKKIKY